MKLIVVFSLLLTAQVASACPSLQGRWHCKYSNTQPVQNIVLEQHDIPGGMLYTLMTETGHKQDFVVDNITRTTTDSRGTVRTLTDSCLDDKSYQEVMTVRTRGDVYSVDRLATISVSTPEALANSRTLLGHSETKLRVAGAHDQTDVIDLACVEI